MQFVVPQFIEVESKVIGPVSVRQFIILLATAGVMWVIWSLFTFWIAAVVDVFVLAVGGIFAFVKINSQPFHIFALAFIQTLKSPNLKVWQKELEVHKVIKEKKEKKEEPIPEKSPVSQSRLAELSLTVDTGGFYKEDKK